MPSSSETRLSIVTESTWGTTPAAPAFTNTRFTGEGLNANIDNAVSDEIRADRNVTDLVQVGQSAGGNIDFELAYDPAFELMLESLMFSSWSSNILKNGLTQKAFTVEKTFELGATDQYHRLPGTVVDTMSLKMAPDAIVTGSFGVQSKQVVAASTAIASSTYTAAGTNDVINAASNFASLAMTGVTSPALLSLDINIANNLAQQRVLGSLSSRGIRTGRFEVTGKLQAYFENAELYALFLAGTSSDLTFKLGGAANKSYLFNVPKLKFDDAKVVAGGNDQDLVVDMSFRGLYNAADTATLKITRTP